MKMDGLKSSFEGTGLIDVRFAIVEKSRLFPVEKKLANDYPDGLMAKVWIEKAEPGSGNEFVLGGAGQLGMWSMGLSSQEADILITAMEKRTMVKGEASIEADRVVLETAERLMFEQLESGVTKMQTVAWTKKSPMIQLLPGEILLRVSANVKKDTILEQITEAIEFTEATKKWRGRNVPIAELATLTGVLLSPSQLKVLEGDWQLSPKQISATHVRIFKVLDAIGIERSDEFPPLLRSRESRQRQMIREVLVGSCQKLKVFRSRYASLEEMVDAANSGGSIDQLIANFDLVGVISTAELTKLVDIVAQDALKREIALEQESWEIGPAKEMTKYMEFAWARAVVTRDDLSSPARLTKALGILVGPKHEDIEMARKIVLTLPSSPMSNPREEEARRVFNKYLEKHHNADPKFELQECQRIFDKWVKTNNRSGDVGVDEFRDELRHLWVTIQKPGDDMPIGKDWEKLSKRMEENIKVSMEKRMTVAVQGVTAKVVEEQDFHDKFAEIDKVVPNRDVIWQMWREQVREYLQVHAQPAHLLAEISLFEAYLKQGGELKDIGKKRPSLAKKFKTLISLAKDLRYDLPADLGNDVDLLHFLNALAEDDTITERLGGKKIIPSEVRRKLELFSRALEGGKD